MSLTVLRFHSFVWGANARPLALLCGGVSVLHGIYVYINLHFARAHQSAQREWILNQIVDESYGRKGVYEPCI